MMYIKVGAGVTGTQKALADLTALEAQLVTELHEVPSARDPVSMLRAEERRLELARPVADLQTARDLISAHADSEFVALSVDLARKRVESPCIKLRSRGWKYRRIRLRSGLTLEMKTPFMVKQRVVSSKRRKQNPPSRRRKKPGPRGTGCLPVLDQLGIVQGVTPATRSEISKQAVVLSSYNETKEQLTQEGLALDVSTVKTVSVETGKHALDLRRESLLRARKAPLPETSTLEGKRIRVSVDGGRARVRQTQRGPGIRPGENGRRPFTLDWREPRVISIDLLDEEGKMDESTPPIYEVTLGKANEVFAILIGLLRLIGAYKAIEIVFIADGAKWIWDRIERLVKEAGLDPARFKTALDYYHATETIAEAIDACKGMKQPEREKLLDELKGQLLESGGVDKVIARLEKLAVGRRAKTIMKKVRYLKRRREDMNYAELRKLKLPIGSGVVESAVRRVINLRFKSASMCWLEENLECLLCLRSIVKAGRWKSFMESWLENRYYLEGLFAPSPCLTNSRQAA